MSDYDDLVKAYNFGNYMAVIQNQIKLAKHKMKKQLRYAMNGGIFDITPEFIIHMKSYADQGIYRSVFIDINENPILIEDLEEFFQTVIEIERTVLNEYYEEITAIRKKRSLMEFLDEA